MAIRQNTITEMFHHCMTDEKVFIIFIIDIKNLFYMEQKLFDLKSMSLLIIESGILCVKREFIIICKLN